MITASTQRRGTDVELMARAAALYYLEDNTQECIASRLGVSRIKVVRLLKKARANGIVEIRVHGPERLELALEAELMRRFGLRQALIAMDHSDETIQRANVARVAADFLVRRVREGMSIAVGMGRNVGVVADVIPDVQKRSCVFVTAIGGSQQAERLVNPAEICRTLAMRFGGTTRCLYAPAYAESDAVRGSFLAHEDVRATVAQAAAADMALVGIGDARDESAVVQMGCFSSEDMLNLRRAGAVGDILGCFFDINGRPVSQGMADRVIGISSADLARIPCVVGVASEAGKMPAILGALRTGMVNVLATHISTARKLVEMDRQPKQAYAGF